jgi:PAS domain S-box-containing protein
MQPVGNDSPARSKERDPNAPPDAPAPGPGRIRRLLGSRGFGYAVAVITTLVTVGARLALAPWSHGRLALVVFLIPVIIGSYLGGIGPGLAAVFLSAVCVDYFFIPPVHSLAIEFPVDRAQWVLMIVTGVLISLLSGALRRQRKRDVANIAQLQKAHELLAGSRAALQSIVDNMTEGIAVIDRDGAVVSSNQVFRHLFRPDLHGGNGERVQASVEIVGLDGKPLPPTEWPGPRALRGEFVRSLELVVLSHDRRVAAEFTTAPVRNSPAGTDCVVICFHDVTERRARMDEIERLTRLYATLSQVNQTIVHCATRPELFEDICRVAIEFGGFSAAAIAWVSGQDTRPNIVAQRSSDQNMLIPGWTFGCGVLSDAVQKEQACLCNNSADDARAGHCHGVLAQAAVRSCAAFPLRLNGEVCGALCFCSPEVGFFKGAEIRLIEEIASDVSFALDKIEREAGRIQTEKALQRSESMLAEGQKLASLGTWEWNTLQGRHTWSNEIFTIYGRDPKLGPADLREVPKYFTPASWARLSAAVVLGEKTGAPYACDAEVVRPDGTHRWIIARGEPLRADTGELLGLRGTVQDITDRKLSEAALAKSESRFRRLFQAAPLPLAFVSAGGAITDRNDRFVQVFGYTEADAPTLAEWWACACPDATGREEATRRWKAAVDRALANDRDIEPMEYRVTAKGGKERTVEISGIVLEDGVLASFNDETERRKAEGQLRAREEQLRLYVEHFPASVAMFDREMKYLVVSRRWMEEYKLGDLPVIGRSHYEVFPDLPPRWHEVHRRCLAGAVEKCEEDPFPREDGSTLWIRWEVLPWLQPDGSIGGIIIFSEDITSRKRTEVALKLFRGLLDRSSDAIHVADPASGRFLDANDGACTALGYSRDELLSMNVLDVALGVDPAFFGAMNQRLRKEGHATIEILHRRKDGTTYPVEASLSMVSLDREYLVAIAHDITERKRTERELRERTAFFEAQAESTPDAILVVDTMRRAILQNHRFRELLVMPEEIVAAGQDTPMLLHVAKKMKNPAQFVARVEHLYAHPEEVGHDELELVGGRVLDRYSAPVRDRNGKYYGRIWTFRDITENRRIEAQFLRAQRLDAIGTLSSGIAHDLNNILAPILMAAGLLRHNLRDAHNAQLIDMMESSAQRGANIIQQLLTFSRGIEGKRVSVQIKHLIKDMVTIARETFPRNITVVDRTRADLHTVAADSTQMHQVLMNLAVNARDAMPNGGTLTFKAENTEVGPDQIEANPGAKAGPHVLLTVSDTGHGIPADIVERIFDPFFTTKGVGKGTGLGLSTVLGIVKSHGGFIGVASALGEGTSFRIYLPAEVLDSGREEKAASTEPRHGRGEMILVVDDEEPIRFASGAMLRAWNYRVVDAANGREGLLRFHEHRNEIKLAIVDQMMPVMGGPAFIAALRAINPDLKVIAVTGMEQGEQRAELSALKVTEILMKPYTPQRLAEAIAEALELGPAGDL